jgi:hypothetical protein
MKLVLTFTVEKETKGAVRYAEVTQKGEEDSFAIGTLYLRKTALSEPYPETLTVTVQA